MKLQKIGEKILRSKYVLYIIAVLSFLNLFSYTLMKNVNAIILFILIAIITRNFSKNMIVILSVPLIFVNFLMAGVMVKEGLDNMNSKNTDTANGVKTIPKKEDTTQKATTALGATGSSTLKTTTEAKDIHKPSTHPSSMDLSGNNVPKPKESFEGSQGKQVMGSRIDYGTTIENAYDDLNKILGGDGINKLTGDTQKLMEQQMKLAEAMNNMGPLLQNAKSMLDSLNLGNLGDLGKLLKSG
jgi:hypothetical protein